MTRSTLRRGKRTLSMSAARSSVRPVGIQKAELKKAWLFEQGSRFDDMIEGAQRDQHRCEGASLSLGHAAKSINALVRLVDDDVEKERYGLEEAVRIKEYIERAVRVCVDMARSQEQEKLAHLGRAEGYRSVVKVLKADFDKEVARINELKAAALEGDSNDPKSRVPGQAPAFMYDTLRGAAIDESDDEAPREEEDASEEPLSNPEES